MFTVFGLARLILNNRNRKQLKAFLKQNDMAIDIVEQLEAQIIGNQALLSSTQKNIKDYFPVNNFKIVADATKNVSIVDIPGLGLMTTSTLQWINTDSCFSCSDCFHEE